MKLPLLYVIADYGTSCQHGWDLPDLARACFKGGAELIQVRAPNLAAKNLLELSEEIADEGVKWNGRVVVNNRADVARFIDCAGVHLGQNDLCPSAARSILGSKALIGISTHTKRQLERAEGDINIDYLAVGPVYTTDTKETGYEKVGLELVGKAARLASGKPVVAVGGITLERLEDVISAGASSVAVISDIFKGGDPQQRVESYMRQLVTFSK